MKMIHIKDLTPEINKQIWNDGGEVNIMVLNDCLVKNDISMLFEPDERGMFVFVEEGIQWHKILHALGCFSSGSEAQRAGWKKDIAEGWTDVFKVAKPPRRRMICAWRPTMKGEGEVFRREDIG